MRSVKRDFSRAFTSFISTGLMLSTLLAGMLASSQASAVMTGLTEYFCADDIKNVGTCNANEVSLSAVTNIQVTDINDNPITSCTAGQQLKLANLNAQLDSNTGERYDVTFWTGLKGNDPAADNGDDPAACSVTSLPDNTGAAEIADFEGKTPPDNCLDFTQPAAPIDITFGGGGSVFLCNDSNGDGMADLQVLTTWYQNKNWFCGGGDQTVPYDISDPVFQIGSPSKCDNEVIPLIPISGKLTVVKESTGGTGTFPFTSNVAGNANFNIDTSTTNPNSHVITDIVDGTYSVYETVPATWTLSQPVCTYDDDGSVAGTPDTNGVTGILIEGRAVTCNFTNAKDGTLTIIKEAIGGAGVFDFTASLNGGAATAFTLAAESGLPGTTSRVLTNGDIWNITELPETGWASSAPVCQGDATFVVSGLSVTAESTGAGQGGICTFVNTKLPTLELRKVVTNDNGGTAVATDWNLSAAGPTNISGAGGVGPSIVGIGTYDLSETGGPSGYTASDWSCVGGTQDDADTVTLAAGEVVVCTITNNDDPASLALVKTVTNDNGGTAVATDWTLSAAGPTPLSGAGGVAATPVSAGTYTLSESAGPAGYTAGNWSCTAGTLTGSSLVLALGQTAVCTIINDDDAASLALVKQVTNDNGGTAVAADWTLSAAGPTPLSGAGGVSATPVDAGTYSLSESAGPAGYTAGAWSCTAGQLTGSSLVLALGETAVCTIVNDDNAASLALVKQVTNDNGGTAVATDWTLSASGPTPLSGAGGVTATPVSAGTYTLSETGLAGYTAGSWSCTAGQLTGSSLVLALGETAVCTIVNDDDPAMLSLVKTVTNNNGGTATPTDWTLSAAGPTPLSGAGGVPATAVDAGTYVLSEDAGPGGYTAGAWSCTAGSLTGSSLVLAIGESATCTINNDDVGPGLTLIKAVTNNSGGTKVPADFDLHLTGGIYDGTQVFKSGATPTVVAGTAYTLSETPVQGYTETGIACVDNGTQSPVPHPVTLGLDEGVTCTISNDDNDASLALVKQVTNDNGGTAVATDWTLSAAGPTPLSGAGGVAATPVSAGTYTLSETGLAGYTAGNWSCTAGTLTGDSLVLALGETAACTIINDDNAASLALVKQVTNDNGGTAVATDWTLSAAGPTPLSGAGGVAATPVSAGTYTLSETGVAGYTAGAWSCTAGTLTGSSLVLALGETAVCTIVNDDDAASLALVKQVINDDGGTAAATDWTLSAAGPTPLSGAGGVAATPVSAGAYTLSETGLAGYTAGAWSCTAGTLTGDRLVLALGETAVCTIINDDDAASLALVKQVTNTNGGTAVPTDWTLAASGPTPLSGAGGVAATPVSAGTYILSESGGPAGYTAGAWSCTAGTLTGASLVLALGETAVCTIENFDAAASLALVKQVTNDNGGTAVATDWTLSAAGPTPLSGAGGVAATPVSAGTYTLSESAGPTGYIAGAWSCTAGTLTGSSLVLALGETAVCTIINNDDAASLALVKEVINDNGGTAVPTDWTLAAAGPTPLSGAGGVAATPVSAGTYTLSESGGPAGYTAGAWSCTAGTLTGDSLVLALGEAAVCTIINDDDAAASIDIEKATNGVDADTAPGPTIAVGGDVDWTYVVTNNGNVRLDPVTVSDDKVSTVTCPQTALDPGESMTCTASGVAKPGQYENTGTATGTVSTGVPTQAGGDEVPGAASVAAAAGETVTDEDMSHYYAPLPGVARPVPTLTEWALILLSGLLALFAVPALRRS